MIFEIKKGKIKFLLDLINKESKDHLKKKYLCVLQTLICCVNDIFD